MCEMMKNCLSVPLTQGQPLEKLLRKKVILLILIIILIDLIIGCLFFKSRSFSHLAVWKIIESSKTEDFYWQPEDVPRYFRFEPNNDRLSIFRNEIFSLIGSDTDEFKIILKVARYVENISISRHKLHAIRLRWDCPEGMLRQIKEGAGANCFHRAILFSAYLSGLGVKSRLWALENDNFGAIAHSVCEVYIKSLEKWVFIDVMLGFYAVGNKEPLSFLELREKLLSGGAEAILVHNIDGSIREMPFFYSRLIKCVFLRADNDFINKYDYRYGVFPVFQRYIDKLPDDMRRGLDYLLGRRDVFIHYVDRFSRSLKPKIIIARLFFCLFIFSTIAIPITLMVVFIVKVSLLVNKARKSTLLKEKK